MSLVRNFCSHVVTPEPELQLHNNSGALFAYRNAKRKGTPVSSVKGALVYINHIETVPLFTFTHTQHDGASSSNAIR